MRCVKSNRSKETSLEEDQSEKKVEGTDRDVEVGEEESSS